MWARSLLFKSPEDRGLMIYIEVAHAFVSCT